MSIKAIDIWIPKPLLSGEYTEDQLNLYLENSTYEIYDSYYDGDRDVTGLALPKLIKEEHNTRFEFYVLLKITAPSRVRMRLSGRIYHLSGKEYSFSNAAEVSMTGDMTYSTDGFITTARLGETCYGEVKIVIRNYIDEGILRELTTSHMKPTVAIKFTLE
jgi:hypothetical protein